jgi:hypothetical protein
MEYSQGATTFRRMTSTILPFGKITFSITTFSITMSALMHSASQ